MSTVVWGMFGLALAVVWLVTFADLARSRPGRTRAIAWVLIILILPIIGAALYWVMRPAAGSVGGAHRGG
jgi:hypothetical protein